MLTSVRNVRVEWCDCDPAGIIFYPRYFEIFDTSTTVLLERALGMKKIEYLKAYDFAGHALVEARARFRQPTRFGDDVVVETKLAGWGRSSFKVEHRLSKAGALAAEGFETRVWLGRDPADPHRISSHPIPAEVLARFERDEPTTPGA
jgi:4-hydroxybenzoyl-CoA thioesterase